ncbi:MAG: hypothetical protein HOP13_15650 [Alphaproteobacteria bacterium]|nr:hypothetical protein [Alphaproteobacteria bacterium]
MKRFLLALTAVVFLAPTVRAEEDVIIRGQFPQILARGETVVQMANRMAVTMINLDRMIAPPCGMKRIFEFAGADYYDENDLTKKIEPSRRGVWRIAVMGKGCWSPRLHNVFLYPRVGVPAGLRLGVPGRSVAGARLQSEAIGLVLREANGIAMRGNCEDPAFLVDTTVTKARLPGKPWTESWSASACEVTRKFAVMFTPEGAKTRIGVVLSD